VPNAEIDRTVRTVDQKLNERMWRADPARCDVPPSLKDCRQPRSVGLKSLVRRYRLQAPTRPFLCPLDDNPGSIETDSQRSAVLLPWVLSRQFQQAATVHR
jgi:hypothetical protein